MYFYISNIRAINRIGPKNEDLLSVLIGYILKDNEKRYGEGVRIVYKQSILQKETLSTIDKLPINSYHITGFPESEAWFRIFFYRRKYCKTGWFLFFVLVLVFEINPSFNIELNKMDVSIFFQIKAFF